MMEIEHKGDIAETLTLSMGPQHPSTHGVLRVVLEMDGEVIRKITPDIGYLHRGIEKLAEYKTYHQVITLTDRLDYLSPVSNNLCYVLAVEKLLDIEIPQRASFVRVILSELSRIASHLVWLGTHALDMGAMSPLLYTFREREAILDIFELVCGARMNTSYFRIGGLAWDIPPQFEDKVKDFLDLFPKKVDEYETLLTRNPLWIARTKGIGIISKADGINFGLSGPNLRGSGVEWDIRKAEPYSGYEHFDFEIPIGENGDVYDRYLVRVREMREATKIISQVLSKLVPGPYKADEPKIVIPPKSELQSSAGALIHHFHIITEGFEVPRGEVYQVIEAPKGELGIYLVSDGTPRPYRMKIRSPSFVSLQALGIMAEGSLLSDLVAVIGSIDIVLGEVDR